MRWISLVAALSVACESSEPIPDVAPDSSASVLSVYTVNYPLQYFAERIGGEHVAVSFPAPVDGDPAYWNPDPDFVAAYQQADLILLNGAGYAKWVTTVTLPTSKLVDTSEGFQERYIIIEGAVVHSHGPDGEHSHGETAFTSWLDPTLAIEHAAAIRDALVAARPEHESAFHEGFAALEQDLAALDERIETAVTGGTDVLVVGSHPVYQYLARRYGLAIPKCTFRARRLSRGRRVGRPRAAARRPRRDVDAVGRRTHRPDRRQTPRDEHRKRRLRPLRKPSPIWRLPVGHGSQRRRHRVRLLGTLIGTRSPFPLPFGSATVTATAFHVLSLYYRE